MKVLFDHQRFGHQRYGGITRYFTRLVIALNKKKSVEARIFAPLHVNEYLAQLNGEETRGLKLPYRPGAGFILGTANALLAKLVIKNFNDIDVFHETYYSRVDCKPCSAARLLTVFDMIHERFHGSFSKFDRTSSAKAKAVARADHIICISESTRRDLVEMLDVDSARTSVVYLGRDAFCLAANSPSLPPDRPFVLYVGARNGYKNFRPFLQAFSQSRLKVDGHRLICFGGGALTKAEREWAGECGFSDEDIFALDGPDELLASFYRSATVFAYPSLCEGFGIPLLEAMEVGCPVVCSNTSAFPEVVGQAAQLFDPGSVESMIHALEVVAYDAGRRSELIRRGRERVSHFSWDKCADETLAVYRQVLGT